MTKLYGATVYNEQGNAVGTIDDMLLDSANHVSNVVRLVGGFFGMDSKYVEVPFTKLKFEPNKNNAVNHNHRVMLPGATMATLESMTAFSH